MRLQHEALSNNTKILLMNFLPRYLFQSAILRSGKDPKTCAEGVAKNLSRGKVKDIEAKSCYCCVGEGRVAFIVEAPSQDALLETLQEQLDVPIAAISEVQEVTSPK
jgi:hypothetical protein